MNLRKYIHFSEKLLDIAFATTLLRNTIFVSPFSNAFSNDFLNISGPLRRTNFLKNLTSESYSIFTYNAK